MRISITESWDNYFNFFKPTDYDIYFEEKYVKLYANNEDKAFCYVYEDDNKIFLFPFLRREIKLNNQKFFDFETAYGYGGPISNTSDMSFLKQAINSFQEYCLANNYIAGFVRFHPLLNNSPLFSSIGQVVFDRYTIAMDLSLSDEDIWMKEIHTKNRNIIKKGHKEGLKFIIDEGYKNIDEFLKLYNNTMDRVNADSYFYFPNSYYNSLIKNLKSSFLGLVSLDDKIISGAIFLYSKEYGHYHLSGGDRHYSKLSPNNFLLYEASKFLKTKGVKKFHLGGGYNSDEQNSLYKFKSRFSTNKYLFNIGKIIFNREAYKLLTDQWEIEYPDLKEKYRHHLLKYKYR